MPGHLEFEQWIPFPRQMENTFAERQQVLMNLLS